MWIVVTGLSTYIEEKRLYIRTCQLTDAQAVAIRSMASVAETRDPETGGKHIFRTQNYVKLLGGEYLYGQGEYKGGALTKESIHQMYLSAPLHDVGGKVGIPPDEILLKPGRLTDEEFEIMKTHAILGGEIISRGGGAETEDGSFLSYGRLIAITHHEKWDGSGYPNGLKGGEEIDIAGRLMAVADVYDALRSRRVYKEPFSHEKSRDIMIEGKGTHFDPKIIDAFLAVEEEIKKISIEYEDD